MLKTRSLDGSETRRSTGSKRRPTPIPYFNKAASKKSSAGDIKTSAITATRLGSCLISTWGTTERGGLSSRAGVR